MFKMTWNSTNNSRDQFKKKIQKNIFRKFFVEKKYFFEIFFWKFLKIFFDKFWKKKITNHLKYFMATKLLYLEEKQAKNNNYFIGQNFSKVHANAPAILATRGLKFHFRPWIMPNFRNYFENLNFEQFP